MSNLYCVMKHMLPTAEIVGEIHEVSMDENWIGLMDRIEISGKTHDGRKFELTLQIEEEKKDGN